VPITDEINYKNKTMSENLKERGLFNKYRISKTNGKPLHPQSEYFILRLDYYGSDTKHIDASRKAVIKYASEIKNHMPELSKDLYYKYSGLMDGQVTHLLTRSKFRRIIGKGLCFLGLHRDYFRDKDGNTHSYSYCVRCGEYKRAGF
jgi:hypothetical protein